MWLHRESGSWPSCPSLRIGDGYRLNPAPSSLAEAEHENAPNVTRRGRSHFLEHETGLEPATPTLAISFSAIP
jgi:hypothetical protein